MQNDHHWLQMRNIRRMEERVRVKLRRRIVRDRTNPFEDLAEEEFLLRFRLSKECVLNLLQNIRAQLPIAADARRTVPDADSDDSKAHDHGADPEAEIANNNGVQHIRTYL
ncbi:hypothetical protein Pcinc_001143 [Petrolisthes cinctipes]|uniref:Uncharacterized protein n=1 Tax=Petrolisthes cinctipes TaxID=88211 RepID=A0AAE1FRF0_PETCI|nr:hypothetical protein Pcinc_018753 [Petrolisthes cinctipes]KAK3893637.1 hypothetical protein Pcinc_002550 [Petrolisthes cinctipes]KAK3893654.1 hypothetical protein Pcinc_002567 [Petrolisthes cinctipes]KAK3895128.1 hypothetical protein Pcinc_001143 [Petrolisthes cinctipes]